MARYLSAPANDAHMTAAVVQCEVGVLARGWTQRERLDPRRCSSCCAIAA
jgi:hypothetical protein